MKIIVLFIYFLTISIVVNAQIYTENFTNQENKGIVGVGTEITPITDVSDVTWSIDTSDGAFTASTDYFAVKNGVFSTRDVDGDVTWQSPSIDITNYTLLDLTFDVGASGDFESSSDVFKIEFVVDGTAETLIEGIVDEATPGDPFTFENTILSSTLQNFSKSITSTGTTGYVKISCSTNSDVEYLYFDNIVLTAGGTLSIKEKLISELVLFTSNGTIITNKGKITKVYNIIGQEVKNIHLKSGVYLVYIKNETSIVSKKIMVE